MTNLPARKKQRPTNQPLVMAWVLLQEKSFEGAIQTKAARKKTWEYPIHDFGNSFVKQKNFQQASTNRNNFSAFFFFLLFFCYLHVKFCFSVTRLPEFKLPIMIAVTCTISKFICCCEKACCHCWDHKKILNFSHTNIAWKPWK